MNLLILATLAAYMAHALFIHWRQGPEEEGEETHLHRGMPFPVMPVMLFFFCQVVGSPAITDRLFRWESLWIGGGLFVLLLIRQIRRKTDTEGEMGLAAGTSYLLGGLLQTALLGVACYIAYQENALGRSLFSPGWVILGAIVGHGIFGVSLCFSHRSLDSLMGIVRYVVDVRPLFRFVAKAPQQLFACIDVSLMEEIIYRVAVQGALIALLGSPAAGIVIAALVFSIVHRHFFYNHVVDSIEFLAFSLLLGVLYYATGSLVLVVMIHTVRNFEIVYFDHAEHPLEQNADSPIPEKAS